MIKINLLKSKKGMTLVEVVTSLAILSIVMIFIVSVFITSTTIVKTNAVQKVDNKKAAAGIENKMAGQLADGSISVVSETSSSFTITFGGTTITTNGNLVQSTNPTGDAKYYYFVPN